VVVVLLLPPQPQQLAVVHPQLKLQAVALLVLL
jgi:hypothetical protein